MKKKPIVGWRATDSKKFRTNRILGVALELSVGFELLAAGDAEHGLPSAVIPTSGEGGQRRRVPMQDGPDTWSTNRRHRGHASTAPEPNRQTLRS